MRGNYEGGTVLWKGFPLERSYEGCVHYRGFCHTDATAPSSSSTGSPTRLGGEEGEKEACH